MAWAAAYVALVLALVVRVASPEGPRRTPPQPSATEPLRLVAVHHAIFFVLLVVAAPGEALLFGGASQWRLAGLLLFAAGVALYRLGATALGDAVSPFVEPAPGAALVTHGVYGVVRHPMYLGQACIAAGAPLTLGARWALALSAVALVVLVLRVRLEEAALRRTYPDYMHYAAHAKRIVPFVF
jgi:protein-S-isoprenylcysteine O-methyltransferase Ste14